MPCVVRFLSCSITPNRARSTYFAVLSSYDSRDTNDKPGSLRGSRSHAPRGNAFPDAPRHPTRSKALFIEPTQSVKDGRSHAERGNDEVTTRLFRFGVRPMSLTPAALSSAASSRPGRGRRPGGSSSGSRATRSDCSTNASAVTAMPSRSTSPATARS